MRKITIKGLKRKAWQAVSLYIRKRDKGRCATCRRQGNECGHFIHNSERNASLGGNALWWSEKNLNTQCTYCNNYKSGNLAEYAIYLEKKYGQGILQELRKLYNTPKKWTREEVQEIILYYEKKTNAL